MAQLKDLLVTGPVYFNGQVYFNKIPTYQGKPLALNKTITITAGNGLKIPDNATQSFDLSSDAGCIITLAHDGEQTDPITVLPADYTYIDALTVDSFGHVTSVHTSSGAIIPEANKVTNALNITIGDSNPISYNGSSVQNIVINASALGLSKAMQFLGVTTTEISANATTNSILINSKTTTPQKGDVVIFNKKEFVWDGSKWIELGVENEIITTDRIGQWAVTDEKIAGNSIRFSHLHTDLPSKAGDRATSTLVAPAEKGELHSEKYAITSGATKKATLQYDTELKAIKFVFT